MLKTALGGTLEKDKRYANTERLFRRSTDKDAGALLLRCTRLLLDFVGFAKLLLEGASFTGPQSINLYLKVTADAEKVKATIG
jgi:hypothetical protein